MMRSLWTAASGMKAEQVNVDTIAHNISNVNTVGYKTQSTQFKTLLYQTLRAESTSANGEIKPTSAQVGLGTRVASLNSLYTDGAMTANDSPTALCLTGQGFFSIRGIDGQTVYYTRNGDFQWSLNQGGQRVLSTSNGLSVLDTNGNPILLPADAGADAVAFGQDGAVAYRDAAGNYVQTGQILGIYQFQNPNGLDKMAYSLLGQTDASGAPMLEATNPGLTPTTVNQGYLEGSNVNVADEMVNLIIAQRAYELNSKAITTSDTMLEQANNLKR